MLKLNSDQYSRNYGEKFEKSNYGPGTWSGQTQEKLKGNKKINATTYLS